MHDKLSVYKVKSVRLSLPRRIYNALKHFRFEFGDIVNVFNRINCIMNTIWYTTLITFDKFISKIVSFNNLKILNISIAYFKHKVGSNLFQFKKVRPKVVAHDSVELLLFCLELFKFFKIFFTA